MPKHVKSEDFSAQEKAPGSAREIDEHELFQLQMIEQSLQSMMMQKQAFQMELVEVDNALSELKKLKQEDVFKIIGTLMIKSTKQEIMPELEKKQGLLNIRLKAIERQENELKEKLLKNREELLKKLKA